MLSEADVEHLQKVARHHARKLANDPHDRDDIAQAGMAAAVKAAQTTGLRDPVAFAAVSLRYACSKEAAKLRRRPKLEQVAISHRRPRGPAARYLHPLDPAAVAALPKMKDHVRDLYRRALVATGFRVKAAAQAIGVGRATLNRAIAADRTLNQP